MAEKVTLKKPDGTIIYPQTKIDTTDLYDGIVTSAKIDWTTMPIYTSTTTSGADYKCSVSPTTAGKYLIIATGRVQRSSNTWMYSYLKLIRSGTEIKITEDQSTGPLTRCSFCTVGVADIQNGDTIRVNFNTEDGTSGMTVMGVSLTAIFIRG